MGILGAFLALGWFGGNLIKDSIDRVNMDKEVNSHRDPEDRIYMRNGKWYDKVTGKRVIDSYINDPVTGGVSQVWVDVYGGGRIYNRGRARWEKENEEYKAMIEKAQAERDPVYLREAEEKELRFAKCVLPYRPGIRVIQEGYIDRMENVTEGKERIYYTPCHNFMKPMEFNHNHMWVGGYGLHPDGFVDSKYDNRLVLLQERINAKKR